MAVLVSKRYFQLLIVEDEAINRMILQQYLQNLGIHADEATSGEEALRMVRAVDYHLILMDIHMPGMDGRQTTRHIRSWPQAKYQIMPIIALTAEEEFTTTDALFTSIVTKPYNAGVLENMLRPYVRI